jgi:hypothetical protein
MKKYLYIAFFIFPSIFLSSAFILPDLPLQADGKNSFWIYEREGKRFWMELDRASTHGIEQKSKKLNLTFHLVLSEEEYNNYIKSKGNAPIHIKWYRFNRAKLSIFDVQDITPDRFKTFSVDNKIYYYVDSTQNEILNGTWVIQVSDSMDRPMVIGSKTKFDVMVLQ